LVLSFCVMAKNEDDLTRFLKFQCWIVVTVSLHIYMAFEMPCLNVTTKG
jgi:hypothetical protein